MRAGMRPCGGSVSQNAHVTSVGAGGGPVACMQHRTWEWRDDAAPGEPLFTALRNKGQRPQFRPIDQGLERDRFAMLRSSDHRRMPERDLDRMTGFNFKAQGDFHRSFSRRRAKLIKP